MKREIAHLGLIVCVAGCAATTANCPEQRQLSATTRLRDAGDTILAIVSVNLLEVRGDSQQITLNIQMGLPADTLFADVRGLRIMAGTDTATVYATLPVAPNSARACCAMISLREGTIPGDAFSTGQLQMTLLSALPRLTFAPARLNPTVVNPWAPRC